ncbi:MAG: hypothetical protein U1A78_09405 [Polyangia bacterium]
MNPNVPTLRRSLRLAAVLTASTGAVAAAQPAPAPPPAAPGSALAPAPTGPTAPPAAPTSPESATAPTLTTPTTPPTPATPPTPGGEVPLLPPPPVYQAELPPGPPAAAPPPSLPMRHAPRNFALSVGWAYTPSNSLPLTPVQVPMLTPQGVNVDARLGWQVGGYQSGWNSYVGFIASFFYYVGSGTGVSDSLGLDYGIFVKHVLFPGRRVRLFVGYGLGAVQVWVKDVGGRGIGHMTRLAAGLDTRVSDNLHVSFEFAYKFNILPSFATDAAVEPRSYDFHSLSLLGGLWFGK